jgi:hypothetical protein
MARSTNATFLPIRKLRALSLSGTSEHPTEGLTQARVGRGASAWGALGRYRHGREAAVPGCALGQIIRRLVMIVAGSVREPRPGLATCREMLALGIGREAAVNFVRNASEAWGTDAQIEEIVDLGDRLLVRVGWNAHAGTPASGATSASRNSSRIETVGRSSLSTSSSTSRPSKPWGGRRRAMSQEGLDSRS